MAENTLVTPVRVACGLGALLVAIVSWIAFAGKDPEKAGSPAAQVDTTTSVEAIPSSTSTPTTSTAPPAEVDIPAETTTTTLPGETPVTTSAAAAPATSEPPAEDNMSITTIPSAPREASALDGGVSR